MNRLRKEFALIVLAFLVFGCASATEIAPIFTPTMPEAVVEATAMAAPPTEASTPTPEASETPEGTLFRDDFSGEIHPSWTIIDENSSKWAVTDGRLQIIGDDPSLLIDGNQTNLFWQPIPSMDFQITVHVVAETTSDFQQAAIFIYQDRDNYVTINRGYCSLCAAGGSGIFMDYKLAGSFGNYNVVAEVDDVYLRLVSQNDQIVGFYALEQNAWQRLGRVGNFLKAGYVGLGVSNSDGAHNYNDDLIAIFDFFEVTIPE